MHFAGPLFYGIFTGFLMSIMLGVIFFMLIQTGIKYGWKKGLPIAAGVITGDIIFIILAVGFTRSIRDFLTEHEQKTAIVGGTVLIVLGLSALFSSRRLNHTNIAGELKMKNAREFYFRAFFINLLNPANAAWWLGLYSLPPAVHYASDQKFYFAAGAVLTVFATEVGVAVAASGLKKFVTPLTLKRIDTTLGIILIVCGIWLGLRSFL